jgi:hypothetical protein
MMGKGHESGSPEEGSEINPFSYGKLQARSFFNARKSEKEILSIARMFAINFSRLK